MDRSELGIGWTATDPKVTADHATPKMNCSTKPSHTPGHTNRCTWAGTHPHSIQEVLLNSWGIPATAVSSPTEREALSGGGNRPTALEASFRRCWWQNYILIDQARTSSANVRSGNLATLFTHRREYSRSTGAARASVPSVKPLRAEIPEGGGVNPQGKSVAPTHFGGTSPREKSEKISPRNPGHFGAEGFI